MINLSEIKKTLEELKNYKMIIQTNVIGKLIELCCELEILHDAKKDDSEFDLITLEMYITMIKDIIEYTRENYTWLGQEDLEFANKIYRTYKKDIKKIKKDMNL